MELYDNPDYYDLQANRIENDIPFYLSQAEKHGDPILELGCGTGRITIPIAQEGWKITGLDFSAKMLDSAREKANEAGVEIEWIKADWCDFQLDRKFKQIFLPLNSITHIHDRESFEALFRCIKRHLSPEGKFILDVFNPDLNILSRDPDKEYFDYECSHPEDKGTITSKTRNRHDRSAQVNFIERFLYFGEGGWRHEFSLRMIFPQELDLLLHYNGFIIEDKFGNFDGSAFTSDSPKQIVVCRVMD
jgi:SAM-dependent methyltransferase